MKRITIFLAALAMLLAALAMGVAACGGSGDNSADTARKDESRISGDTAKRSLSVVGKPDVKNFAEKANLKRRYEEVDDPKATGYIYLIDHGLVFAEYTVEGKVSSLNSQFTNPEFVADVYGNGGGSSILPQQEPDGSYGANPEGIFFWTTDTIYVEWAGNYLYSKKRLEIQQPAQNIVAKEAD